MSFWGQILGTQGVIEKAADGIYNGVDAAFFTKEEKAGYFLNLLKAYEPFKVAQRLLAILVGVPYVVIWVIAAFMFVGGAFSESSLTVATSKELAVMNNDTLGAPFAIICAFYFGGGMLEGAIRARNEKT